MHAFKQILLLSALAAVGTTVTVQAKEKDLNAEKRPEAVATVEGITEYRLDNGLRVVLYPDESKPTATVNMTYLVGSRHENYGETGMAHLLEHLMFKGSKNYPNPTAEFTKRGFRMNGTTWLDRTNYFVSFTATDDNMKWALGWQADSMTNAFIAKKDLDTEMTVVRNEYEMGENRPVSVMLKRMQSVLFDWHSYGRNTIGARSDIENVEIENLQAFYHRYYQPDNAVLTVSGKFDVPTVLGWVQDYFGPIPKPTRTLPHEWTVEPTADGERFFTIRRPGEQKLVAVGYRIPAALAPDYEPLAMGVSILGTTPTGRLYKELVETGMASQVFGWTTPGSHPGFVMFGAMVDKDKDLAPVREKLVSTIENAFKEKPAEEAELKLQQNEQALMFDRALADPEQFAVGLSDYIALGDWRLFFADREEVASVTVDEVNQAAAKYLVRDNRVVGEYIPTTELKRAEIAPAPSAEEVLKKYDFKAEGKAVAAFDPSQDNLNASTKRVEIDGIKTALLPKASRGETVTVSMQLQNGDFESAKKTAVSMLGAAMLQRGTDEMTRDDIDRAFTENRMEGSPFTFTTDREHVAGAIALAGHLMTRSTFPEKEFETLKSQMIQGLKARSDDPRTKASDAITKHFDTYPKGDPRHTETSEELLAEIEAVTLDQVKDWYKNVFGTTEGNFAVVGDFDEEAVKKALSEKIVGEKTKTVKFERVVREYRPVKTDRITIDTPEKENAVLYARVAFPANQKDADRAALLVADHILGGSSGLSNRIVTRLRQKEGLSYGAGSNIRIPFYGDAASWSVLAIVAPQNIAQAEASLKDELARAVKDGITEEELADAKKGMLDARAVNRAQDSVVAQAWTSYLERGLDWTESKKVEEQILALTVEDVNKAIRRFADPENLTIVLAGDREKAKEAGKDFFAK